MTINESSLEINERKYIMGMNLRSCCHKCRVQKFHLRGKENESILPFYKEHYECMRISPRNIETQEDQVQEMNWMGTYKDIYEVEEEKSLGYKFLDCLRNDDFYKPPFAAENKLAKVAKDHYLEAFDKANRLTIENRNWDDVQDIRKALEKA